MKIANTLALIFLLVMNTLAITLPLNGKTTGELSDMYPNLFVPAGFTFSIWSVIFLGLIALVVYQWKASAEDSQINTLGPWFAINGLANGLWVVAWHYEMLLLSIVIMLILLVSLIMMHRKLDINYFGEHGVKWFVFVPISIYLGWISVATIANFTTILVDSGWSGGGISEEYWASIMLAIAVVLGGLMMYRHKDIFFAGVIAWASYGILSKRTITEASDGMIEHISQVSMYVMIVGIVLTVVIGRLGNNKTIY